MQYFMLRRQRFSGGSGCFGRRCFFVMWAFAILTGCTPGTLPLASLPMDHPQAAELNLRGIDRYQAEAWQEAFDYFHAAMQEDPDFAEAYFNAALALHQMDRHEEARRYFQRAGELDPQNEAITGSALYRHHLELSSRLERHLSGGYRYQD